MARPRINRNQRTIDDIVIEDPTMADALDHIVRHQPAAKELHDARQVVKTRMQTDHPDLINLVDARGKPVYIICDSHRFIYRTAERPAGKKPAPAGVTTLLEVHRLDE